MKKLLVVIVGLAFTSGLYALETRVRTWEGTGTCGKCNLETAEKCTNVLKITSRKGKELTLYCAKNLEHGEFFCKGETEGLVAEGFVKRIDGKLILTATSVEKKEG